jgi:O-antigen/teichoic acid export membrane protein
LKNKLKKLKEHPKYDTVVSWGKLISITGSVQLILQALGFASGILIIRLLPVQEYAFYTLANTMLGTMTVLSDGGISAGVMAQGGRVWKDKEKLGVVLATGLDLRKKFAIGSLLIMLPVLFYLLVRNNASWITSLLIVLSLIPAFFAVLSDSLLEIVPKLHQAIIPLQKNQMMVAIGRLFLSALVVFIFPWSFAVILASGIPRIYGNFKLRKISYKFAEKNLSPDIEIRNQILTVVKRIMPGTIYFAFNGQLTIWLLSIFGTATSLAQVGAIGRFSLIFGILGTVSTMLISPYFAKSADNNYRLRVKFYSYLLVLIFIIISILLFVNCFSALFLSILGTNYKDLHFELILVLTASSMSFLSGISFNILSSKGWPTPPVIIIAGNICFVLLGIYLFDIRELRQVLFFNIFIGVFPIIIHSLYFFYKTKRI